jgi:hypothetical protein
MPALVPGEVSYAGLPVPPGAVIILAAAAGLVWEDQRNIAIGNRIRTRAASEQAPAVRRPDPRNRRSSAETMTWGTYEGPHGPGRTSGQPGLCWCPLRAAWGLVVPIACGGGSGVLSFTLR